MNSEQFGKSEITTQEFVSVDTGLYTKVRTHIIICVEGPEGPRPIGEILLVSQPLKSVPLRCYLTNHPFVVVDVF